VLRLGWSWSALCAGVLLASPSAARAQVFYEFGGGWNYFARAPDGDLGDRYTHGFSIRASAGRQLAPAFRLRIDAFVSFFGDTVFGVVPPPNQPPVHVLSVRVAGLMANGLLNVDPRGILYLIGGAGLYDAYLGRRHLGDYPDTGMQVGISGGAGIAVPVGRGYRVFIEASYHSFSVTTPPSWMLPITVGLRF
jgi:hypothetical protein